MPPFNSEVSSARAAHQSWSRLSIRERLRPVRNLRALIASRADNLYAAVAADIGRPAIEVLATELLPVAAALKFLERRASSILAPKRIGWSLRPMWLMGCRDVIHRRPWGVVGVIGTWNYPLYLNVGPIAQALVAGNSVLWKPSENAERSADLLHSLFLEAGFPRDLFQKLPATREAGPQLAEAEIDYFAFTGSDTVGRKLAAKLGERLIPSTLELSGHDAMFVFADADLQLAAKAAWFGLTLNRGQTCIAVRRIFVQRARHAEFVAALEPFLAAGKPMSLVMESQRTQADKLIADAVERGAQCLSADNSGITSDSRLSVMPTVLTNVHPGSLICTEPCFAPLAAVIPFDTPDDAEALARRSPFGLSSSIFTADTNAAKDFATRIPAGSVVINDVLAPTAHAATPFGGRGASGWGVTQGAEGLLGMTVPQVVTVRKGTFRPHFDEAITPDPATVDVLRGLLRWTHARGLREKFRGLWQMLRGVRRQGKDSGKEEPKK
jgi:acyl-CoA reductase-like NAD-dependent aldehyde dehydrogenase